MEIGKNIWVFADGDLPPQGDREPLGHEALMVVNDNGEDAVVAVEILFSDQEPQTGVTLRVPAKRVECFRLDFPIGDVQFQIPKGQYALILRSSVPVVAAFGRLDRRENMAYYSQCGFSV